jgi:hypothetical protein
MSSSRSTYQSAAQKKPGERTQKRENKEKRARRRNGGHADCSHVQFAFSLFIHLSLSPMLQTFTPSVSTPPSFAHLTRWMGACRSCDAIRPRMYPYWTQFCTCAHWFQNAKKADLVSVIATNRAYNNPSNALPAQAIWTNALHTINTLARTRATWALRPPAPCFLSEV